jgi:hypothetical protein
VRLAIWIGKAEIALLWWRRRQFSTFVATSVVVMVIIRSGLAVGEAERVEALLLVW